ncbi:MAG TPA: GGDEF domain-containing protein [Trueperaceae bacterium]
MNERPSLVGPKRAHPLVLLLIVLLVPLIAFIDYLTGPELGSSLFYTIPIVVMARIASRFAAWATLVLAALGWMTVDVLTTPSYTGILIPLWNTLTRVAFFTLALVVVRNTQQELRSARIMALSDPLTGLPNRQYLLIMLGAARARLERYGSPLTLAFMDVDDFKPVNDRHGHLAGDKLLQEIATVLVEEVRDTDTVARIGGDEFLILLPDAPAPTASQILERVRNALAKIRLPEGSAVSFSIGACTFLEAGESIEAMLRRADEQMYRVKRSGKDAVRIEEVG